MRKRVKGALAGALTVALAAVGVGTVLAGGASGHGTGHSDTATAQSGSDGRMVLISGRDDHGLVATARVALYERPGGDKPVAEAGDGTLAQVVSTQGTWLEVRDAGHPSVHGWVDDFYLRGTVHLVGPQPTCEVPFAGRRLPAGEQAVVLDVRGTRVLVRTVRSGRSGWVARSAVREFVPDHGCGRPEVAAPPESHHHHHSHG